MVRLALLCLLSCLVVREASAALVFGTGDYFTSGFSSDPKVITEYNASLASVGSLTLPSALGDEVRGVAFGPDGLLYTTVVRGSGAAVLAMDRLGNVQQTYAMPGQYAGGCGSCGKLTVDGQHIYVSIQDSLTRFDIGNPSSGQQIYTNNQVTDSVLGSNGNLFVASAYQIDEITSAGTVLRSLPTGFPGDLAPAYTDIRGIEYDPVHDDLFVTMLGYTGFFFQLMRVNATTGALEKSVAFHYGDDLFRTLSGDVLVGADFDAPQFFSQDLVAGAKLGSTGHGFVTQKTVPEPPALALLAWVSGLLATAGSSSLRRLFRASGSPREAKLSGQSLPPRA
jgi:hypothetical protein